METSQQDLLIEEALHWLVLLREDEASAAEREQFEVWLAQSPDHDAAWRRAEKVWAKSGGVAAVLAITTIPDAAPHEQDEVSRMRQRRSAAASMTRRNWIGAAAAATFLIAGSGYLAQTAGYFADYRTGIGEHRSITLADGSVVDLASSSAISVSLDGAARNITLLRGEAFFRVARDTQRAFVVHAADGSIKALGTAFNVKTAQTATLVSVTEHAVEVSADRHVVTLREGQQVRYDSAGPGPVQQVDIATMRAWNRGRLVYMDAPLGEVITDLERHRPGRIVFTDERLKAIPVTAAFNLAQPDQALRSIADTLPVRIRFLTDYLVIVSPAS